MLLEMKNVVKQFGGLTAVSNMSFHVDKGEIFGVIGPNGAGKTTIFNLITGVYQVTEGDVVLNGTSIEGMFRLAPYAGSLCHGPRNALSRSSLFRCL